MTRLRLYDHERSGNCYKVRSLLFLLGLEYARSDVDIRSGATRETPFRVLNPRAQIPVLADGETVTWDSMATLAYLARRYGDAHWLPTEPLAVVRVMPWLAVAGNEILYGLSRARSALVFGFA